MRGRPPLNFQRQLPPVHRQLLADFDSLLERFQNKLKDGTTNYCWSSKFLLYKHIVVITFLSKFTNNHALRVIFIINIYKKYKISIILKITEIENISESI